MASEGFSVTEEEHAFRVVEALINLTAPPLVLNYQRRRREEPIVDQISREQALTAIGSTTWAQGWAAGLCRFVAPALDFREKEECVKRLSRTLAEKVLP